MQNYSRSSARSETGIRCVLMATMCCVAPGVSEADAWYLTKDCSLTGEIEIADGNDLTIVETETNENLLPTIYRAASKSTNESTKV